MDYSHIQEMSPHLARKLVRRCLEEGAIIPGFHFRAELNNEHLDMEDAYTVLRRGNIYNTPVEDEKTGEFKYQIEGHEPGGKWIVIVFCFKRLDTTYLITVYSVRTKRRKK